MPTYPSIGSSYPSPSATSAPAAVSQPKAIPASSPPVTPAAPKQLPIYFQRIFALLATKWVAFPLFIFVLILLGANTIHSLYFSPQRTVSVTGIATRKIQPETAVLSFSVTIEGTDRASTIADGERQFNQMLEGLKDYNLVKVDRAPYQITETSGIALSRQNNQPRYRYVNAARITVADPARVSDLSEFLYSVGASSVGQARFVPKDEKTLGQELRSEAVKDSRKRVEEMAKAAGSRVGKVLSIQENSSNSELGTAISAVENITADANLNTVGEIELGASVVVIYELK